MKYLERPLVITTIILSLFFLFFLGGGEWSKFIFISGDFKTLNESGIMFIICVAYKTYVGVVILTYFYTMSTIV